MVKRKLKINWDNEAKKIAQPAKPPRNPQAGPLLFFLPIEGQEKTRIEKAVFSRSGA
jgi:hypothetical protein